ncbi:MAG: acetyl-CoA/propionyl-CoA carboxylase, biotin carboxylase, biotin carboxyl carrier protein [Actinomycetota bacterium]|nr:acetyl-CoA/propionyl-CoA carboxylase, biotin carboxylase, biotin carboxyl carrier protein [Actinomycetota bacterium]
MLKKILIANRGEIAIRVMRTCRELGIATVAVYSDLDRDAAHVRFADEAYALGGQTAAESYLNTDAIIRAINTSGADGVHPGYGFFSENADFARTITAAGVTWIGPPPEAIEVMGDKISSRLAAARAEVESVPGTTVPIADASEIVDFGEKFGYPIAIKAAYGGGGRGMKVVANAEEAQSAFDSAQREAKAYFGRDECYMERYLTRPRHVELQVFTDTHGNGVYLSDRDCSAQRRHQKLIEEAPAPAIPDETRRAMGEAAVKVALACGYVNAGTVEMLFQDGEFFFLEMNTRLQVEHCVTEEITGLDLVAEQLRVASGEPLSFTQESVEHHGHSIECRINAEDPSRNFMPSPGTITRLRVPSGPGVRWDGGYTEGDAISQYYDNLIGKLIVWAPDRDRAIERMLRALGEFEIEGVRTTIPAHNVLLAHEDFRAARHSTKWVEDEVDQSQFAATAAAPAPAPAATDGEAVEDLVERTVPVEVDGRRFSVRVWLPPAPVGGGSGGAPARARPKLTSRGSGAAVGDGTVSAPMQGTIVSVLVEVGATVEVGQALLVLEAMKMENHINAERSGTIAEIRVAAGDSVGTGDVLAIIS